MTRYPNPRQAAPRSLHRALRATRPLALALALLLAAPTVAADAGTALDEEFRQALLRLAQAGALPAGDDPVVLDRPAERVVDFGLLVDRDHADGLLVLGTLPGGSAERMGLRHGDRLLAANGADLRGAGASERMRSLLDGLDSGQALDVEVLRDGRAQRLAGRVAVLEIPAMRVELRADGGDGLAADPQSRCARISTVDVAPSARNLFPVTLLAIDGELPGPSSQDSFRVRPGRLTLQVGERIDAHEFSSVANLQRSRGRPGAKTLELEVVPGVTYQLAAELLPDQRGHIIDGGYWRPVVWRQQRERCD